MLVIVLLIATGIHADGHPAQDKASGRDCRMFRYDSRLNGVHRGPLPSKLSVRWRFNAPDAISSTAAIVDNVVYVGCEDGTLIALDLSNGSVKWKYETESMIQSSPAYSAGMVFYGDDDGIMHAVNADDGKSMWMFETSGQIISSPNVVGSDVVFGSYDGFVYCLDATSGKVKWKFETAGRVHGTPGIVDGFVLVAGCDEYLHKLKLADGSSAGKVSMDSVSGASAAVDGPRVFVGTYGNQVRCFNWKDMTAVWTFEDSERQFPFMGSAAVTQEVMIIGGRDKRIRAFAPESGKVLWTFVAKGRVDSSAVVVGNRVFIGASDGNLYDLDRRSGKQNWVFETGSAITASPAVANRCLVIGTLDGDLYCFSGANADHKPNEDNN